MTDLPYGYCVMCSGPAVVRNEETGELLCINCKEVNDTIERTKDKK